MSTATASGADRPATVFADVYITAIIAAILMIAPVVVGALITRYGFTPAQAGVTISVELGAMSLASWPALWWLPRWSWRKVLRVLLSVMIAGNLACAFVEGFAPLAALRALTGLAGGSVMVVCIAVIGMTRQTERNFGWWTVSQLVLGAIGLALLPRVLPAVGLRGLYLGFAALLLLCLPMIRWLPERAPPRSSETGSGVLGLPALLGLAGILCLYVALGGVWTYVERIGAASGLGATLIGDDLTVASLCGIAGCGSAVVLGARWGRVRPLLIGFALILVGCAALAGSVPPTRFLLAAGAFKYAWTFALPYILAGMASHDHSGRLMAIANFMIGGGLAIGPALAAALLGTPPDYGIVPFIGMGFGAASLVLLLASMRRP
ncbi:MAG: MFS transporter [Steroidobacteraceae bacterium]